MNRPLPMEHPGVLLNEELEARGIDVGVLAAHTGVDVDVWRDVIAGARAIDYALSERLHKAFGTSPGMWRRMQHAYDQWPQPGDIWRHHRGGEYEIISIAVDEATGDDIVVYKGHEGSKGYDIVWTRPVSDFLAVVDGSDRRRFELVL